MSSIKNNQKYRNNKNYQSNNKNDTRWQRKYNQDNKLQDNKLQKNKEQKIMPLYNPKNFPMLSSKNENQNENLNENLNENQNQNNSKESNLNFASTTKKIIEFKNIETNNNNWLGCTIINKNDRTIKTYNDKGIVVDKKSNNNNDYINQYQLHKLYLSMSNRWCNYYNEINYLIGDRSPYINYKDEILKIVSEENDIMSNIYGDYYHSSSDDDNDYNDDVNLW